jgi:hypothetical protein
VSYSKSVVSFVPNAAESCAVASEHIKMPPSARRVRGPASLRLIIPLRRRLGLSTLGEEQAMFQGWQGFSGRRPRQAQAEARLSSVRFRAFPSGNLNPVQMRTLCQPQDAWFESHNSVANYYSAHLAENKPAKQPGSRLEIGVHFVLGAGRHRQHARARGMRRWRTAARSPHP